jgi:hypothetical protein
MKKRLNKAMWTAAGLALVLAASVMPAKSQFGVDLALILTTLQQLNSTMQTAVGIPMQATATYSNQLNQFQQQVMYPQQQINQYRGLAQQSLPTMTSVQNMFRSPINSATLPTTRSFEQQLLGGNTASIGSISSTYTKVYGAVPPSTQMTANARNALDMNDAQAQAGMKKAVELDAIATKEFQLSQQLMQQLTTASPGAASMISAQAAAWNLQANAYSQSGMAQLLRVESADQALSGSRVKQTATLHSTIINNLPH